MNIPNYNIELAHIYADQKVGLEQYYGIRIASEFIKKIKNKGRTFVTSVLIDDYNSSVFSLKEEDIIDLAKECDVPIDFIAYESKLDSVCDKLIKDIENSGLRTESFPGKTSLIMETKNKKIGIRDYFGNSHKNTCASVVVAWSLCRLGIYDLSKDTIVKLSTNSFIGTNIVTVLPERYESNEEKALAIIKNTPYTDLLRNIEYLFFQENLGTGQLYLQ